MQSELDRGAVVGIIQCTNRLQGWPRKVENLRRDRQRSNERGEDDGVLCNEWSIHLDRWISMHPKRSELMNHWSDQHEDSTVDAMELKHLRRQVSTDINAIYRFRMFSRLFRWTSRSDQYYWTCAFERETECLEEITHWRCIRSSTDLRAWSLLSLSNHWSIEDSQYLCLYWISNSTPRWRSAWMKEERIHLFEREEIVTLPSNEHESRWNSSPEPIILKEHSMGRRVSCERIPLEYSNYWSLWHSPPLSVFDRIDSDGDLERSMSIVRWWKPKQFECRSLSTGEGNHLLRYSPIENCCFSSVFERCNEEYSSCQCNQERISPSPIVCQ